MTFVLETYILVEVCKVQTIERSSLLPKNEFGNFPLVKILLYPQSNSTFPKVESFSVSVELSKGWFPVRKTILRTISGRKVSFIRVFSTKPNCLKHKRNQTVPSGQEDNFPD